MPDFSGNSPRTGSEVRLKASSALRTLRALACLVAVAQQDRLPAGRGIEDGLDVLRTMGEYWLHKKGWRRIEKFEIPPRGSRLLPPEAVAG